MKIEVKAKHIKEGQKGDMSSCAVALAVKDALKLEYKRCPIVKHLLGDEPDVEVNGDTITVGNTSFEAGEKVSKFVEAFDEENEPNPDDYTDGESSKDYKDAVREFKKQQRLVRPFSFKLA